MMTKKELRKLRKKIGPGYLRAIQEKTGFAYGTISHVIRGDWHNQKIIDAAFEILKELNEKQIIQKQILES